MKNKVLAYAKSLGYKDVRFSGKWKTYDVYEPIDGGTEPMNVGKPEFIFVSGDRIFLASEKEAFEYIDSLPEE